MGTNKKFCPNCGAPLDGDLIGNKIECRYCGNVIEIEQPKEKKTYQPKTTIAEEPICEIIWADTYFYFKNNTVEVTDRIVAIAEGEKRKIHYLIYNTPVKREIVTKIDFEISHENKVIRSNTIDNVVYDKNTSYASLENELTNQGTGIYTIAVRVGNSKWYKFPLIIGKPKELDSIYLDENKKKCITVTKNIIGFYTPKNKYTHIMSNNTANEKVIRKHFAIPENVKIYLFYDCSLTGNFKKGMALCENGLYFNGFWASKKHIDWYNFLLLPISTKFGLSVGDLSLNGAQEADKIALLLGKLQRGITDAVFQKEE